MVEPTPLKNDGRIASWDDFSSPFSEWKNNPFMFQTTNQEKFLYKLQDLCIYFFFLSPDIVVFWYRLVKLAAGHCHWDDSLHIFKLTSGQ